MPPAPSPVVPFAVACLGIALFCAMDTAMKGLAIAMGAYSAMLWRQVIGAGLAVGPWLAAGDGWPKGAAMRFHIMRGGVGAAMAVTWFYGLARMPMAEAIALSFIAPLIALYLSAVLLGEQVRRSSVIASLLGLAGVALLLAARLGQSGGDRALDGIAAIFASAVLYAWNLILMRQQALVARPAEVAFFQNAISGGWLWLALPLVLMFDRSAFVVPTAAQWPLLAFGAALTVTSLFLLSWAYARAEANVLVPVEYTGFVWLALLGAVFYDERLTWTTLAGTALIITGCLIAAHGGRAEPPAREAAA